MGPGYRSSLRGRVETLSGEPLRKAEVTAAEHQERLRYATLTDAAGRFDFPNLSPGQYRLHVRRTGYVPAAFGGQDEFQGVPITLAPDRDPGEIVFRIAPQSVLTGRVVDEDGDPLEGAQVSLLREVDFGHGVQLAPRGGSPAVTDDRGVFRISAVAAGTWFLSASFDGPGAGEAYPTLYYPDCLDPDEAQPIRVPAAAELTGFELRLRTVAAYHVRGRVEVPPDADRHSISVHILPRRRGGWVMGFGGRNHLHGTDVFELDGILPGSYTIRASCNARQTELEIEVTDRDLDGLVLRFREGAEVRGVLRGPKNPGGVHVSLANCGAVTASDGSFTLQHVPPGTHRVRVWQAPVDWYLKSLSVEIPDAAAGAFLEIELAGDGAVLGGTVESPEGRPLPGAAVHLRSEADVAEMAHFAIADQDGRFEIRGIAPGAYRVVATRSPRGWDSPEAGESLTLAASENRSLTLRVSAIQ